MVWKVLGLTCLCLWSIEIYGINLKKIALIWEKYGDIRKFDEDESRDFTLLLL